MLHSPQAALTGVLVMEFFYKIGSIFQASEERVDNGSVYFTPKESLTGPSQRGKLSKSDIGSPTNFKHVTHVGLKAVPGFDPNLDLDKLFTMAGVKEEHLEDQELSQRIFSVLEKAGSLENVRKQTRRMTTVERPSTRARLRSLSSSSITPSKRQNGLQQDSPHAAKMLAHGTPLCYRPSLSKVPPPMGTPEPFSHFHSIRSLPPMPPYLEELSQSFSPAAIFPLRPHSKKAAFPPQPVFTKNSTKMPPLLPVAKGVALETNLSPPSHHCHNSNMVTPPSSLPHFASSLDKIKCIADTFPPSIPFVEPPIKLGDVPSPPPLPQLDNQNFQTIPPCMCQESLISVNIPPPPTPPFAIKQSSQNPLCHRSECSVVSQIKETNNPVSVQDAKASIKEPEQQNNPMFLDQIKQGVQLKSVTQPSKVENADCLNIVTALMDVIKRRHKAIHSSDEDEVEDDEWED
ncbi:uncharacterized protein [Dendrobates tinctorius]|uniref:uncharacterized protein isoform X2 n=1 Tax=Dendrobates tinctorius TaxID=92724 RepID=UPI003CCA65D2